MTVGKQNYFDFIEPEVCSIVSTASEDHKYVLVYYPRDEIDGYEIINTLMNDLLYAISSISFVGVP